MKLIQDRIKMQDHPIYSLLQSIHRTILGSNQLFNFIELLGRSPRHFQTLCLYKEHLTTVTAHSNDINISKILSADIAKIMNSNSSNSHPDRRITNFSQKIGYSDFKILTFFIASPT